MKRFCLGILIVTLTSLPAAVSAQVAWDSPLLLPPRPQPGLGIFLADMDPGGLGVLGTWRSSTYNYGLRFGIAEGAGDEDLAVFGGVDYLGTINTASTDFPLDVDWLLGAGASVGDGLLLSAPAGLTVGHSFQTEGARFIPYVTPRVIFDAYFASGDSDLDLGFAVDVGLDVRLMGSGGPFAGRSIRFGASIGDRDALALGLVF